VSHNISWFAWTHRIGQVRGVSAFAPVRQRLQDVAEVDAAERTAATINAMVALFVKRELGAGKASNPFKDETETEDGKTKRFADFQNGMVFDNLQDGESIESPMQHRPNMEVMKFRDAQIRAIALALRLSASALMRRYDGTYSAQRQELVETAVAYRVLWRTWVDAMERPKWYHWLRAVRLAGLVSIPSDVDEASLMLPVYTPPVLPWIDPQKEAEASARLVESGIESREHVMRQRGRDPQVVWTQIEREKGTMDRVGFVPSGSQPKPEGNERDEGEED